MLGSWARGKPVAKGKGAHFNTLLSLTPEVVDWVSLGIDGCTKVKVYKAKGEA